MNEKFENSAHQTESAALNEAVFNNLPESQVSKISDLNGEIAELKYKLEREDDNANLEDFGDTHSVRVAEELSEERKNNLKNEIAKKEAEIQKLIQNN
jgi:hypothetical protein